jgi:hypothetical protein
VHDSKDAQIVRLEAENSQLVEENERLRVLLKLAADKIEQCMF